MIVSNRRTVDQPDNSFPVSLRETTAERKPVHGMAVIYATAAARRNADQLSSRLIEEIGDQVIWQKGYFHLAMLKNPEKRRAATELASGAEVVILALENDCELSEVRRTWMEEWSGHLFDRGPILIAVYGSSHRSRTTPLVAQTFLEKIADACGLTFLYTRGEGLVEHRRVV